MVDCIWFKWQKKHKLNKYAFDGGSVQQFENTTQYSNGGPPYLTVCSARAGVRHFIHFFSKMDSEIPTDGLSPTFTVADMIGTTEGALCYVYD
jgi:tyrosinase